MIPPALAALLFGCARYEAAPVDAPALADAWRARTLGDTVLLREVSAGAGMPQGDAWTAAQLAMAAEVRHTDVAEARGALEVAKAGEISAGARPQPGISGEIGHATDPGPFESPWFGAVSLSVTIELGGKRGARIAAARARTARASVEAAGAASTVALRVHEAHVAALAADSLLAVLQDEQARLDSVVTSARRRVEEGEISSSELARLASEQATLQVERSRVAAEREVSRQLLARALAMPRAQLGALQPVPDRVDGCHAIASQPPTALEERALTHRTEVGRALADYAEAEALLRVEVARTWPDLVLTPGFVWDGGIHRWNLLTALPEVMLNRNRGPIAEAAARRALAGVRIDAAQQAVLSDVSAARAECDGALRELATADSAVSALAREAAVISAAVERGERGERDRLAMELVQSRARRERHVAATHVAQAGVNVERALNDWLADPAPRIEQAGEGTR